MVSAFIGFFLEVILVKNTLVVSAIRNEDNMTNGVTNNDDELDPLIE